jgi:hypothetical protein
MKMPGIVAVCALGATIAVGAQPPGGAMPQGRGGAPQSAVGEVQGMYNALKNNITRSAEQFPEDKYDWSPTPDVRTFGGLISHISDDNNGACFTLAGESQRPPMLDMGGKPTDAGKGMKKADILKVLAESFARCDKAFGAVTPENMMERQGNRSRLGVLVFDTQHIAEHYGNIVSYMRLQGMVPPSSAGGRMGRGQ